MESSLDRYSRQVLFPPIGPVGQRKIRQTKVGLVGLGALGSTIAETLVRAGIGSLIAVDRDIVEFSNLHRQGLYQESDAAQRLPKALAAERRLRAMNASVTIEAHVTDFRADNAEEIFSGCDCILDGTDSFETRYLVNDLAVSTSTPWIYGACVAATGMTATIIPQVTPCLTCLFPDPPPPGAGETCDTAGIIAPAAQIVAALQVTECLKLLSGDQNALRPGLLSFELWPFRLIEIGTKDPKPRHDCQTCVRLEFPFLEGDRETEGIVLCGRDSVQIRPPAQGELDLKAVAARLETQGKVSVTKIVLNFETEGLAMTLFKDGRALIRGTTDPAVARQFFGRFVGS